MQDSNRFRLSKTGVRVYVRSEYHPALKGTNLLYPDFRRKAEELFGGTPRGEVIGLPRICSENSEDAQTWHYFSPLLSMTSSRKAGWLKFFFRESLGDDVSDKLENMLPTAELMFWRGRKERPFYLPPPSLGCPEGNTEVDLTISMAKAVVFVEAKYRSEIAARTTYCRGRDQIVRNIDVGTFFAWNNRLDFYFILLTSRNCKKSISLLKHYKNDPWDIAAKLRHRADISSRLHEISKNLGLISWEKLQK
jgi:hypothetical protein